MELEFYEDPKYWGGECPHSSAQVTPVRILVGKNPISNKNKAEICLWLVYCYEPTTKTLLANRSIFVNTVSCNVLRSPAGWSRHDSIQVKQDRTHTVYLVLQTTANLGTTVNINSRISVAVRRLQWQGLCVNKRGRGRRWPDYNLMYRLSNGRHVLCSW